MSRNTKKWKKSLDLSLSCILLSSSLFTLYLIVRTVDASYLSEICQINGDNANKEFKHEFPWSKPFQFYIFLVQISISSVSVIASVICIVASTDHYLTKWSLLSGIVLCVVSTFGSLMIVVISVLNTDQEVSFLILRRMIQLCLCVFIFVSSFYNMVVLVYKYRTIDRMQNQIRIYASPPPIIDQNNFGQEFSKHILISVPVLVTIINLSGGAAILGFAMGRASMLNDEDPYFLGGLHSGILAITSCIAVIFRIYVYKQRRPQKILVIIVLLVITIISSLISFYTEDIELNYHILRYDKSDSSKPHSHYIQLAKSALIIFSNLFIIVFGVPLLACICECATLYFIPYLISQQQPQGDNFSQTEYDNLTYKKSHHMANPHYHGTTRDDTNMSTLQRQTNPAYSTLNSGPHKLYTANGLVYNLDCDTLL